MRYSLVWQVGPLLVTTKALSVLHWLCATAFWLGLQKQAMCAY